jgi:hypothetical protein
MLAAAPRAACARRPVHQTYVLRQGGSVALTPAATGGAGRQRGAGGTAGARQRQPLPQRRVRLGRLHQLQLCAAGPDGSASNFVLSDNMPNGSPTGTQAASTSRWRATRHSKCRQKRSGAGLSGKLKGEQH